VGFDQGSVLMTLTLFIPGEPAPQGSKRYLGKGIMIESSKKVKPWRADIRAACLDNRGKPKIQFNGDAVRVDLEFVLKRPVSAPKKRTPPAIRRPDLDKLVRATLDGLGSANIWTDDSQVVSMNVSKRLAEIDEVTGCRIVVERVG
jgi:crossover junction endodeoxyribonuclease RusA